VGIPLPVGFGDPLGLLLATLGNPTALCPSLNVSITDLSPLPFIIPVANVPLGLCILGPAVPGIPGLPFPVGLPFPFPFLP
jgi:hypothetical protein